MYLFRQLFFFCLVFFHSLSSVAADDIVFRIDAAHQEAEIAKLDAAIVTAEAQLANLQTGKRSEELDVTRAQRQEVEATLDFARAELKRATSLTTTGAAAVARWDAAQSQVKQLEARLLQLDATLRVGELAGRGAEIAAARSRIEEARAALAQAMVKRDDLGPRAPVAAQVENTFFDVGEWVQAGQPVVSLLPPGDVRLRFYVPEMAVAGVAPGTLVRFTCDGCGGPREARVTAVASQPEYTPPVIYSQGARAKLVYLVEAKPVAAAGVLRPGLPIEVEPQP